MDFVIRNAKTAVLQRVTRGRFEQLLEKTICVIIQAAKKDNSFVFTDVDGNYDSTYYPVTRGLRQVKETLNDQNSEEFEGVTFTEVDGWPQATDSLGNIVLKASIDESCFDNSDYVVQVFGKSVIFTLALQILFYALEKNLVLIGEI